MIDKGAENLEKFSKVDSVASIADDQYEFNSTVIGRITNLGVSVVLECLSVVLSVPLDTYHFACNRALNNKLLCSVAIVGSRASL